MQSSGIHRVVTLQRKHKANEIMKKDSKKATARKPQNFINRVGDATWLVYAAGALLIALQLRTLLF